jgi:hypothetical protein
VHARLHSTRRARERGEPLHAAAPRRRRAHAGDRRARPCPGRHGGFLSPNPGSSRRNTSHTDHPGAEAATADETRRAAVLFHRAGDPVVTREGNSPWAQVSPHARVAAERSPGSGAARRSEPGAHRGPHRSPPHRPPPDRLRLAISGPSRTAGHGKPRPQLGSGDPVRPVKRGGFLLFKNSVKILFPSKNPRKSVLSPKITKPFPENL